MKRVLKVLALPMTARDGLYWHLFFLTYTLGVGLYGLLVRDETIWTPMALAYAIGLWLVMLANNCFIVPRYRRTQRGMTIGMAKVMDRDTDDSGHDPRVLWAFSHVAMQQLHSVMHNDRKMIDTYRDCDKCAVFEMELVARSAGMDDAERKKADEDYKRLIEGPTKNIPKRPEWNEDQL